MKIAFVLTQDMDSPGGVGRFGPLARELVKLGHEVEVIALHSAFDTLRQTESRSHGVKVSYVAQMHVYKSGAHKHYFSPLRFVVIAFKAVLSLARALWRSNAEIIHLGKAQPFNVLAAVLAKRGRSIYCDCDDYEAATNVFSGKWQRAVVRFFEDNVRHVASGLTVNTTFIKRHFEDLGFPSQRIVFVPNGIERARFQVSGTDEALHRKLEGQGIELTNPIVLYVGSLGLISHPIDMLLEALQIVSQKMPCAQLVLAGGGEDFDKLQQMAADLGVGEQTFFIGRITPSQIPDLIKLTTITVDPVRDDLVGRSRCPLKVMESLAMGVPVATSDVGDRSRLLDEGRCGTIARDNAPSLAEAMLGMLESPELRQALSEQAYRHAENYYWDKLIHQFVRVYE